MKTKKLSSLMLSLLLVAAFGLFVACAGDEPDIDDIETTTTTEPMYGEDDDVGAGMEMEDDVEMMGEEMGDEMEEAGDDAEAMGEEMEEDMEDMEETMEEPMEEPPPSA